MYAEVKSLDYIFYETFCHFWSLNSILREMVLNKGVNVLLEKVHDPGFNLVISWRGGHLLPTVSFLAYLYLPINQRTVSI